MGLIDVDLATDLYSAVDKVRAGLPVLEALVEIADPALAPAIEVIRAGQTALFELVSKLELEHAKEVDEIKAKLREDSVAAWRAGRG